MGISSDLKMYGRFALGLRGYLRHTISLEEAIEIVQKRLAERETNFLRLVKKGILGYPKSPYLSLLKLAHCEFSDIEKMVKDKGLEVTLQELRKAGVYVTFEEFKGREPIVRNGKAIPVKVHDFDNPFLSHYYQAETAGTTGAGTRVDIDLDHLSDRAPNIMLARSVHGVLNLPTLIWRGILPDSSGATTVLLLARYGKVPEKWFSPITNQDLRSSLKYRLATRSIIIMGRLFGAPFPWPEPVPLDQAIVVACWAAEMLKTQPTCLIITNVSMALRVCVAAQEKNLNLKGAIFMGGGEPPTPAKVKLINATGACYIPNYSISEVGHVGTLCAQPVDTNDIHLFKDTVALIQYRRQVPGSEITVDAFHFTTLLLTAPKLMLNVESDDYGVIENRSCGCPLEAYGFTEHLRHIRSFRKLTGEGVTLVGSEMVRILEEVLPARFGGSPLDYQLFEEEDENGFTRISLLVSPEIKIIEEQEVIETVLQALKHSSVAAGLAQVIWSQAKTLRVKRMKPIWTVGSKLMPLHLSRETER